jgi:molybdopterin-binding protein
MFKLNGVSPGSDSLLLIKSDSIVLTNEMPEDKELNAIKGKITEIIPSEFGMEVTIDAGDLFYVNIIASDMGKLKLIEEKEVWMSFTSKDIVVISGN